MSKSNQNVYVPLQLLADADHGSPGLAGDGYGGHQYRNNSGGIPNDVLLIGFGSSAEAVWVVDEPQRLAATELW